MNAAGGNRARGTASGLLWTCLFTGAIAAAMADDSAAPELSPALRRFDIPAQSLSSALSDYSGATGIGVLVDGAVTAGRVSAPVKGVFAPAAALQALLEKTGLAPRYVTSTAFTLVPMPELDERADLARERYFAAIQLAVTHMLCQRVDTRPGSYRTAVRLWIDEAGAVRQAELLSSTGEPRRDAAISGQLKNMAIAGQPSFRLPQPITMVLLPRAQDPSADCPLPGGGSPR